jgi:hypothetical protein
VVAVTLGYSY